jgi:hypothetical protein
MTEADLEEMSAKIDKVLERHNLPGRVRGGYVAGSGILFTFNDATFSETAVLKEIQQELGGRQIVSAPGAIVVQR